MVLVAQQHNPSLLNPDFLKNNGFVDRNVEVREALTTPAFSRVAFANGIVWTLDSDRCVVQKKVSDPLAGESIYQAAGRYIQELPHIPYRAVGLNWAFWFPVDSPEEWLSRQFMDKHSIARKEACPANLTSLTLQPPGDDGQCTLTIAAVTRRAEQGHERGIQATFNFHFDVLDSAQARSKIELWPEKRKKMEGIAGCYFGDAGK